METTLTRTTLTAARLPAVNLDDWNETTALLADAAGITMRQAWLPAPLEGFLPARVRTGWTDEGLLVWGELEDADIFNPVTEFNGAAFQHGDVFEIFLRPHGQEPYFEFHITPGNQLFQLRLPSIDYFATQRALGLTGLENLKIKQPVLRTRVKVDRAAGRWSVLALVPFQAVIESLLRKPAGPWLFSFCRYDYTRGQPKPIISSTSPHVHADFHRQQEWGELHFEK